MPVEMNSAENSVAFLREIRSLRPFSLKRRSNPSAAFRELHTNLLAAVRDDEEVGQAFASLTRNFKGTVLKREDAVRLKALESRGSARLGIKVRSFSDAVGPGIAYMYDAALETLRSSDQRIGPNIVDAKMIRMVERSLDDVLPVIGSMSVAALEQALDDEDFRDRLQGRASEVGTAYLDNWNGPCEFCELRIEDELGNVVSSECGTEEQCANGVFVWLLIIALLILVDYFVDWLND